MSLDDTHVSGKPPVVSAEPTPPAPQRRAGCGSCLLGCLGTLVLAAALVVLAGWYAWKKLPDWSRNMLVSTIEASELPADQKQRIVAQIDRVVSEYKAGRASFQQVSSVLSELADSPLFSLSMAYAAAVQYIEPSGLGAEEKEEARIALQRVARGVYEKRISVEQLDPALDYVSTRQPNGQRQFAENVTDQELRALVAECRRLADDHDIPPGPFEVDIAAEVQRAVDRALQTAER